MFYFSVNTQEFLDIRMQENDFVLCNQQVVRFYDWATAQDNNITIEGWAGGEDYTPARTSIDIQ